MLPVLGVRLVAGASCVLLEVVHSDVAIIQANHQHVGMLWMEIQTHDAAGGVAQKLWVGRILQRKDTDHAWLALLVEII